MIGAGDGKLAAVTGGFLGIRGGLSVVMIGLFLGALWSAGRMWKDRSFGLRMGYLFRYAESLMGQKTRLSYDDLKGWRPGTGFLWRHVCQPGDISICLERLQSDLEDMFYETDYGGV